jgi:hypothetical protein
VTQVAKHWKFYYRSSCHGRGTQVFQVHFIVREKFCNRCAGVILSSLSVRPDKDNTKIEWLDWEGQKERQKDWRTERLEDWRTGGLEDWRTGGQEDWRTGGQEDWRTGGLEDRRTGSLRHQKHYFDITSIVFWGKSNLSPVLGFLGSVTDIFPLPRCYTCYTCGQLPMFRANQSASTIGPIFKSDP